MSQLKLSGDASGTGIVTVAAPNTNSTYTVTLPAAAGTFAQTDVAQTFTGTQTFSSNPVLNGGTANGVLYLNGSKVATSGSVLTFDGTTLKVSQGYVISWQSVQTTGFTAVAGRGYPCNTTSAAFTVTLPASPAAGDVINIIDYAGKFQTNNLTINPNGNKFNGDTGNYILSNYRQAVQIVYIDSTQGWEISSSYNSSSAIAFTLDYLVLAGGGGGAGSSGSNATGTGGGGAGGYREASSQTFSTGITYTLTVGAGGAGSAGVASGPINNGASGSNSVFGSITSLGGGGGGTNSNAGLSGGSGGGGSYAANGGNGTSGQGNSGGAGTSGAIFNGGGGGGSTGTGTAGSAGGGGAGGAGTTSSISGTSVTRAGGGGGGAYTVAGGAGGAGGGGAGGNNVNGSNATAPTSGNNYVAGGGGGGSATSSSGGNGAAGLVVIKIPDTRTATFSAGVTQTNSTSGGFKTYIITAAGSSDTVTFS